MRRRRAELFEDFLYLPGEDQIGRAVLPRRDFHVLPTDSATPTCLQRFERRFFCCETGCIMLCGHDAAAVAVFALGTRKDTLGKARGAQKHFANSCDFDNVYTDGNNHE